MIKRNESTELSVRWAEKCLELEGEWLPEQYCAEVDIPAELHAAMTWAQRLKCVFSIEIEVCGQYGEVVKVIAWY